MYLTCAWSLLTFWAFPYAWASLSSPWSDFWLGWSIRAFLLANLAFFWVVSFYLMMGVLNSISRNRTTREIIMVQRHGQPYPDRVFATPHPFSEGLAKNWLSVRFLALCSCSNVDEPISPFRFNCHRNSECLGFDKKKNLKTKSRLPWGLLGPTSRRSLKKKKRRPTPSSVLMLRS